MADNTTCDVCGGEDFYKDAGYFYCTECQTQSQQIQEHVHEIPEELTQVKKTRKLTTGKTVAKEKKRESHLTSWESFNYVLIGLVKELIILGAKPSLKMRVLAIWMMYLKKQEVFSKRWDSLPKVSAAPKKRDLEVVYGHKPKKRTRRNSDTSASGGSVSTNAERRKRKKLLAQAEYDQMSRKSGVSSSSVHNQSLQSIKTSTDASTKTRVKPVLFNTTARKQIRQKMTRSHYKRHRRNFEQGMKCHKFCSSHFSRGYRAGHEYLSRQKLYAILYLGLLVNQDDVQLSDLLRFNREGYLSFARFKNYFPEDLDDEAISLKSILTVGKKKMSPLSVRRVTAQIANSLLISFPMPNLVSLCRRYCVELNLPDQLCQCVLKLMAHAVPQMKLRRNATIIPNYEGRVMAFILYTIKLIFGLDGVTEHKFSDLSKRINDINSTVSESANESKDIFENDAHRMFNFSNWKDFIVYRQTLMEKYHFPTFFLRNGVRAMNPQLFLQFYTNFNSTRTANMDEDGQHTSNRTNSVLKSFLEKLKDLRPPQKVISVPLNASLTPFVTYSELLVANDDFMQKPHNFGLFTAKFDRDSLEFLLKPRGYLKCLTSGSGEAVLVRHGGANDLWFFEETRSPVDKTNPLKKAKNKVPLIDEPANSDEEAEEHYMRRKVKEARYKFQQTACENSFLYTKWLKRLFGPVKMKHQCSLCQQIRDNKSQSTFCEHLVTFVSDEASASNQASNISSGAADSLVHYLPYENYWVRFYTERKVSMKQFKKFQQKLPDTFVVLLTEFARILEQPTLFLYEELNFIELYRGFVVGNNTTTNAVEQRLINKAKMNW